MLEYGTEKTSLELDGNTVTDIKKYKRGGVYRNMKTYKVRVKVLNAQEEMTEFIHFTKELAELRTEAKLTVDGEDPATYPTFTIHYPREDIDGSYFIVKSYTIII